MYVKFLLSNGTLNINYEKQKLSLEQNALF